MRFYTNSAWWIIARSFWDQVEIVMLRDLKYNDRTLPKWHVEEWETLHEACRREVYEESWLKWIIIHSLLSKVSRQVRNTDEIKTIYYYLMTLEDPMIEFETTEDNSKFEIRRINIDELPRFYLAEQEELVNDNIESIKRVWQYLRIPRKGW